MESFPLNLMSCCSLGSSRSLPKFLVGKTLWRAACEGVPHLRTIQIQRTEILILCTVQGLCWGWDRAQPLADSKIKQSEHRKRSRLAHPAHFPWPEAGVVSSAALLWLLRIPSVRLPRAVVAAPSLPSAQGILVPVLKDKGILFSTMDSLWEMGWDCSAAQWI